MTTPIANAGSDAIYAYGTAPATVGLTGAAAVLGVGRSVATWGWQIIGQPDAGTCRFVDTAGLTSALQNPTLENVPAVGDVVVVLVIVDDQGAASETDYRLMPDSAMVVVGVTSRYLGLRRMSMKEKGWASSQQAWLDALDAIKGLLATLAASELVQRKTTGFTNLVGGAGLGEVGPSVSVNFIQSGFVQVDVASNARLWVVAWFELVTNGTDAAKLEITLSNSTGGTTVAVATQSTYIGGGAGSFIVRVETEIEFLTVADPTSLYARYQTESNGLAVDDRDVLSSVGVLDLDPASARLGTRITSSPTFGAGSTAKCLSLTYGYKGP